MSKESFAAKVETFISTASAKGSQIGGLLLARSSNEEIARWETNYGVKFTDEIAGYATVLGKGIRPSDAEARSSVFEFIPGYGFISLDMGLEYLKHYKRPDVLVSRTFRKHFKNSYLVPFSSNVVDFVSFCRDPQGGTGVMLKRNSHAVASEIWFSAASFFDFQTKCWELGGYKLDANRDVFQWDTEVIQSLQEQFSGEFIHD